MKHAVSRELFAYWDRLRKGRSAPERGDIDPAAIRGVLSDTFIVATEQDFTCPVFPIRLSGTRMNALFLTELKGRSLLDLWEHNDRESVARVFAAVLDDAAPLVAGLKGGPAGHRPIDLEMVLLPLRHHGRTHARILGAIAPVELPSWLGLLPIDHLSLMSLRLIDPALSASSLGALRSTRPAPPVSEHGTMSPRRYGRFVVHQGGR